MLAVDIDQRAIEVSNAYKTHPALCFITSRAAREGKGGGGYSFFFVDGSIRACRLVGQR